MKKQQVIWLKKNLFETLIVYVKNEGKSVLENKGRLRIFTVKNT